MLLTDDVLDETLLTTDELDETLLTDDALLEDWLVDDELLLTDELALEELAGLSEASVASVVPLPPQADTMRKTASQTTIEHRPKLRI